MTLTYTDQQTPSAAEALSSFAAICAKYTGHVSNWLHILPSPESAKAAFDALPVDLQATMVDRAARHGLEGWEIMQKVPEVLWDRVEMLTKWLDMFDISHVVAKSVDPTIAGDQSNWTWENSGVNRGRKAATMTGDEYRVAVEDAKATAEDMTGEAPFWDWNDIWHGFLDVAETAGMTAAWLPKEDWKKMMAFCQDIYSNMKEAKTFSEKVKASRLIAIRIKKVFRMTSNHLVCAFLLAVLTLMWPPVQWFIAAWALTGLAGFVVSCLRLLCRRGMGYKPIAAILRACDKRLEQIFAVIRSFRSVLDWIKDGIFYAGVYVYDLIFGKEGVWTKVVQPVVQTYIRKAVKVVKSVVKSVGKALTGFISWIGSLFG